MNRLKYIYLVIGLIVLWACNNNQNSHGHSHDVIGAHDDNGGHSHEGENTLSYTLFSGNHELFVEFPALVVGKTSSFAAHFTLLDTYKPASEGKLTVSIIKGDKGIRHSVDAPKSAGIFSPALQPKEAGTYQMLFELTSKTGNVSFEIAEIKVYKNEDEAAHSIAKEEDSEEITFLKEQAWKTEFATQGLKLKPFYSVIKTSARVKSQPQSERIVSAQAEGTINLFAVLGESVRKGQLLAIITGSGLENNLTLKLNEHKIAFEKSKADFKRSQPLVEKQLISQKDFLEVKSRYQQDSLRYHQVAKLVSKKGLKVIAPTNGFISNINISNGEFVNNGTPIFSVNNRKQILIEAFVNQSDFKKVNGIFDANFTYADKKTFTLAEINGKVLSSNAFVNSDNTRIPVTFSAQNANIFMPGMFLEAFLKTDKKENTLVIPLTAIVEEQGLYYVFVQTGGESFIKRQVDLASNDGLFVEIESGLVQGERIVTKGAYQVKLAAMAGDLPVHGHTH